MVNRIIAIPVFGNLMASKKLKIPFITYPRILEIGPKNAPSYLVKSIYKFKPPIRPRRGCYVTELDHILPLKKGYNAKYAKLSTILPLVPRTFQLLPIHTMNR